jgi:hypothetical protein
MIPNPVGLRQAVGRRACCTEHTEMNIWQQDIDETLQGHNLITVISAFAG